MAIESKTLQGDHIGRYTIKSIKEALKHLKSYTEGAPEEHFLKVYRETLSHILREDEVKIIDLLCSQITEFNLNGFK